jgi:hypothetical protein
MIDDHWHYTSETTTDTHRVRQGLTIDGKDGLKAVTESLGGKLAGTDVHISESI